MNRQTICCAVRSLWLFTVMVLVFSVPGTCFAGLVQYWTFDDGAGTTAANEVGPNTGTLVPGGSGPDWVTSGLGTPLTSRSFMPSTAALSLDPSTPDYINLGNLGLSTTASSGEVTLSMWINPNTLGGDMRFFGQLTGPVAQGGAVRSTTGGGLQIWNGGAWLTAAPASSISTGVWQHLAMVWTNDSVQTFVNGLAMGSPATSTFDFATSDFGLGARFLGGNGTGFDGLFDDVSIWDHAITTPELISLATGQPLLTEPVPIPEPSSCLLLGLGAVGLINQRRRSCLQR